MPDRASLERVLAERQVPPTGEARRFELTVQEASWSNDGQEPGGLIEVVKVRDAAAAGSSEAIRSGEPSQAPEPTMEPNMSDMPGMDH